MTDRELLYIKTIAEERNITRAAEKLHIAQPSLTQCLQRIEKKLECTLFVRSKTGLDLTDAGRCIYQTACHILHVYDGALAQLAVLKRGENRPVTVGASWYNTLLILTGAVSEFSRRYPGVDVQLLEKNTNDLLQLLSKGTTDLILTHEYPQEYPHRPASRDFDIEPLFDERFCVVAHENFRLEERTTEGNAHVLDLKELSDIPMVSFSRNQRIKHITDFLFDQAGVMPRVSLFTYGFPSAVELAEQKAGVVLLPESYVKSRLVDGYKKIRQYQIASQYPAYWTTAVCCRKSEILPDSVQNFLLLLKSRKNHM